MIRFELVDVKDISSSVPRSHFSEATIDQLAELILACGGLVKPLVLKRTGLESFEILEGHLEYYAAAKAKQKRPGSSKQITYVTLHGPLRANSYGTHYRPM